MFLNILSRKAENAGGYVEEFDTKKTFLSQICHNCNSKKKKSLSQRWHNCKCGIKAQRDLYSAYLSRFIESNRLNKTQAKKTWAGAHLLLEQAILSLAQATQGEVVLSSFGISQRSSLLVKDRSRINDVKDVVGNQGFREL